MASHKSEANGSFMSFAVFRRRGSWSVIPINIFISPFPRPAPFRETFLLEPNREPPLHARVAYDLALRLIHQPLHVATRQYFGARWPPDTRSLAQAYQGEQTRREPPRSQRDTRFANGQNHPGTSRPPWPSRKGTGDARFHLVRPPRALAHADGRWPITKQDIQCHPWYGPPGTPPWLCRS